MTLPPFLNFLHLLVHLKPSYIQSWRHPFVQTACTVLVKIKKNILNNLFFFLHKIVYYFYLWLFIYFVISMISNLCSFWFNYRFENFTESHLHSFTVFTIIGAWLGAFPIPLDWDRPWQAWPITCCIGASLGYSAAHFFMGSKLLLAAIKGDKKSVTNRPV